MGELGWPRDLVTAAAGPGHRVTEVVPPGFAACVRALHSWYHPDDESRRERWADLAVLAGIALTGDTPAHAFDGFGLCVDEGTLEVAFRDALITVLAGDQPVTFAYDLAAVAGGVDPFVVTGPLADLPAIQSRAKPRGPATLVARRPHVGRRHGLRLSSTYIACSQVNADKVLSHPDIEALLVDPNTRIDELPR
ncbi:hypothetical protein [Actinokineospora inagensis]|uniref:hypothetical protein n=1 Tax=Actinokineospora inagensis TaxID=103730 RepID=UPI000402457B|nr:hypothetical protein [Actinokineospora inagensis]